MPVCPLFMLVLRDVNVASDYGIMPTKKIQSCHEQTAGSEKECIAAGIFQRMIDSMYWTTVKEWLNWLVSSKAGVSSSWGFSSLSHLQVTDAAQEAKGKLNQLLGIRGASQESNIWKIRLQLTKPVTWVPLIWGKPCDIWKICSHGAASVCHVNVLS